MKIRLLATMAGPGGTWNAGEIVVLDDDVARELVAAGYARPLPAAPETAMVAPPEQAVRPAAKPKKRAPRRKRSPRKDS